ncbi:uncharacterized protein BDV14DRAFT_209303 [Aspergillus stella-maris]|uniref:uncharacterized protein n=1 Tax=Aspergillus stella-maris TaxID=1810926 RepID=UPI003CCD8795
MNSTTLEGWQFNDNSRSSWDIVWTCLTTIFACSWTALITAAKLWSFVFNFLTPEAIALNATEDLWHVRSLRDRCNAAQESRNRKTHEPGSWLYSRTRPLVEVQDVNDGLDLYAPRMEYIRVTVNIIGRARYGLSITPFEFMTLAYITMDASTSHPAEMVGGSILSVGKTLETAAVDTPKQINRSWRGFSLRDETIVNTAAVFHGLIFCGVHVGAWTFAFPTSAERIAWRVFSLTALVMLVIYYILGQAPLTARWLKTRGFPLPAYFDSIVDPLGAYTWWETIFALWIVLVYIIARFGMIALVLSSLRALPSDAYIAVDWLASIPHI